jgi:hypothetical protein
MAPQLVAKEEGPPTKKELNLGVIHTIAFPHYDSRGQVGFCYRSARSTSLPGLGWALAPTRFVRGGFPHLQALPAPRPQGVVAFNAWHDRTSQQAPMRAWQEVLNCRNQSCCHLT